MYFIKKMIKQLVNRLLKPAGYVIVNANSFYPETPVEATKEELLLLNEADKYSMTGKVRIWALLNALKYAASNNIEGDCVECGVWRGGNLILMRKYLDKIGSSRKVYGYDTFEGMSEPTEVDVDLYGNKASEKMKGQAKHEKLSNIHAFAGFDSVSRNLNQVNAHQGVILVKGKVEDSLLVEENIPDKISILRLDTDWYESTKIELERLYPKLSTGGVLIIDDYGHYKGAKKAVDEYFLGQNVWFHYVDYTCRLLIKK